ncbi:MaoC family dehydratase [Cellulomonas sp. DKR-3]|uniref:MaoC family dehydratase n=1 Tax=Cellulomonas fulva TaxID=2835530 RepID=A0ABS5TXZ9_9CELL|nr:MaoC/PaaZ C-terminal domain-containing protein [Cellulomonas fulva]MBT0994031.1 MaoC family dehydratase [Cellulomonas fulva]
MTLVDLPAVPGLGGLYARGAAASGRLALARRTGGGPTALPDVAYRVRGVRGDLEHLAAFQRLVGEPVADTLPPGFVHVLAFPVATALMARSDFPLPLLGMVHLANVVEQHRPVRYDETLDVVATAGGLRPHRTGTQVDLVVDVTVDDEIVWRGTSTYLAKGVRLGGEAPDDDERVPFDPPLPTGQWRLGKDTGRRYAAVSGDRNPIHLSALSAKALGFPRAIAHGMHTASRLLADVGPARGDAFVCSVDFVKPVLLPATVATSVRRAPTGGATFELAAWHPRTGKPHALGTVRPLS